MRLSRVLIAGAIWLILCLSLWLTDSKPAVIALAAVVVAATALVVVPFDAVRNIGDTGWSSPRRSAHQGDSDPWVTQLRHQMAGARQTGSPELHARLVALVIDQRTEGQPLTPALRELLDGSPSRLAARRTLLQTITEIEAL